MVKRLRWIAPVISFGALLLWAPSVVHEFQGPEMPGDTLWRTITFLVMVIAAFVAIPWRKGGRK